MSRVSITLAATLLLAACAIGCKSESASTNVSNGVWKSQHFDVLATVPVGWRTSHINSRGDTYDRPDGVLAAFLNESGPFTYIIRVENDTPFEQVSIQDYLSAIKSQHDALPAFTFIDESDLEFHGRPFHLLRYKIIGGKAPSVMQLWIYRDGKFLITLQMIYPVGDDDSMEIPSAIATFDRGVKFNMER